MQNKTDITTIIIDLNAVILSVDTENDHGLTVLTIGDNKNLLPWGLYDPNSHNTMEKGLRHWVRDQTTLNLDYVEQLYTFGDSGRFSYGDPNRHIVSIGYLASIKPDFRTMDTTNKWSNVYRHFPWEDFRTGRPAMLDDFILPELYKWSKDEETKQRIISYFGDKNDVWQEENVLKRFEIMYEANLVFEAIRDGHKDMLADTYVTSIDTQLPTGRYMQYDHRRILATALGRMRAKIKYYPIIFDLMPATFTLFDLQKSAESILGYKLHKQNFRRFVEREKLVTKTDKVRNLASGRPAKLYEYNKHLAGKGQIQGIKIGNSGSAY